MISTPLFKTTCHLRPHLGEAYGGIKLHRLHYYMYRAWKRSPWAKNKISTMHFHTTNIESTVLSASVGHTMTTMTDDLQISLSTYNMCMSNIKVFLYLQTKIITYTV